MIPASSTRKHEVVGKWKPDASNFSMNLPTVSSVERSVLEDRRRKQRRLEKDREFACTPSMKLDDKEDDEGGLTGCSAGELSSMQQELESSWNCVKCTFLNAPDDRSCEACGGISQWRIRLREKKAAAMTAHRRCEERAQEQHQERCRDLMDLEEEEETEEEEGGKGGRVICVEQEVRPCTSTGFVSSSAHPSTAVPATEALSTSANATAKLLRATPVLIHGGGPFQLLPSDLLLHCLSFLHEASVYAGLRAVAKHWNEVAEHESLWRMLAEKDWQEPKRRACLLGGGPSRAGPRSTTPVATGAAGGKEPRTPGWPPSADGRDYARTPSASSPAFPAAPATWACSACGLRQADPFGLNCEFCSTEREIILPPSGPPAGRPTGGGEEEASCFRVVKDYQELAEIWRDSNAKAAVAASGQGRDHRRGRLSQTGEGMSGREEKAEESGAQGAELAPFQSGLLKPVSLLAASSPPTALPSSLATLTRAPASGEREREQVGPVPEAGGDPEAGVDEQARSFMAGTGRESAWEVAETRTGDFYWLYKMRALDRIWAGRWDSLHRGWEWLSNSCRVALRARLYATREQIHQRDDSLIPITSSFQKCVNKLTRRDWPLLWECMRAEFALQAEALRRDIIRHMRGSRLEEKGLVAAYRFFLQDLLKCFGVYTAWVFEVSSFFMKMNDQISGESFRATTAFFGGCGALDAANTPSLPEVALVAFRDHVVQHFSILTPVLQVVEGDGGLRLAAFFQKGGDEDRGAGREAPRLGEEGGCFKGSSVPMPQQRRLLEVVEPEESEVDEKVLATRGMSFRALQAAARHGSHRRITMYLAEDLIKLGRMAEELDVMEQGSASQCEAFRRLLLKPLRATLAELRVDGVGRCEGGIRGDEIGGCDREEALEMMAMNEGGDRVGDSRGISRRLSRERRAGHDEDGIVKRRRLV